MVSPNRSSQWQPIAVEQARVMVVEDKLDTLSITKRLLLRAGITPPNCVQKVGGTGVVQFAEASKPLNLILLDLGLPDESGYAVLVKLRRQPELAAILVVVITGHGSLEEMRRAQDAGFDGFIAKPLQFDRFPDQVRRILKGEPIWESR